MVLGTCGTALAPRLPRCLRRIGPPRQPAAPLSGRPSRALRELRAWTWERLLRVGSRFRTARAAHRTTKTLPETAQSSPRRIDRRALKFREVRRLVRDNGWVLDRQEGSHEQYRHPTIRGAVTIAGKDNKDVPKGTLANILRQAGLK